VTTLTCLLSQFGDLRDNALPPTTQSELAM